MKHHAIIKLSYQFYAYASGIISPEELKTLLSTPSEDIEPLTDKIFDISLFFNKEIEKFKKPSNHVDAKNNLEKIQLLENNYLPYFNISKNTKRKDLDPVFNRENINSILGDLRSLEDVKNYFNQYKDYCNLLMQQHYYGGKLYIRFGKYPKQERSRMGLYDIFPQEIGSMREVDRENKPTFEAGVSAYRTTLHDGKWRLIDASRRKAKYDYRGFNPIIFEDSINAGDIYLVTGKELNDTGADGEPLLIDIFPIKKLSVNEIILEGNRTLGESLARYETDLFQGFKAPEEERELALGIDLLKNINKPYQYPFLSEEENNWLNIISLNTEEISENDKNKLLELIRKIRKEKNKELVMSGYRPLY